FGSNFDGVVFRIRSTHTAKEIRKLKEFIASSEGNTKVKIILNGEDKSIVRILEKRISMGKDTKKWLRKFK
ncbi:TPA: hypothetical protein DEP90_02155, partial [Patescibacteria group bacterium]|nr:hypothetical protein [Patescibacteria group bacterium]